MITHIFFFGQIFILILKLFKNFSLILFATFSHSLFLSLISISNINFTFIRILYLTHFQVFSKFHFVRPRNNTFCQIKIFGVLCSGLKIVLATYYLRLGLKTVNVSRHPTPEVKFCIQTFMSQELTTKVP